MFAIVTVAFGLSVLASARPTGGEQGRMCRVGNFSYPTDIYEAYAGLECYERTYSNRLTVHACVEKSGETDYNVPCIKIGSKTMSFNLKNDDTVLEIGNAYKSQDLNNEMIKCYLNLVGACEFSPGGWFEGGPRSFLFNTTDVCALVGQSKFHIAMLSISLIVGIPVTVAFSFYERDTRCVAFFHCRNLILVLVLRTFFTLLTETQIVSVQIQSMSDTFESWAGCKALSSFETITLNLVSAFWLIFTFYLSEYSKYAYRKEPNIKIGIFIVLGFSLALATVWMIIMAAGEYGMCWMEKTPVQWVNDSLRIGFILLQIFLVSTVTYTILTEYQTPIDPQNDMIRRATVFTLLLSPLYLIQFSLNAAHTTTSDGAFVYAEHFFDGLQCCVTSLSYFFLLGVHHFLMDKFPLGSNKKCNLVLETMGSKELEVSGMPRRVRKSVEERSDDIIYSSVLSPERFEKTIKLYNRLNVIPKHEQPAVSEDVPRNNADNSSVLSDYYDVDSIYTIYDDVIDYSIPNRNSSLKHNSRYYSSKYLVQDTDTSTSGDSSKESARPESCSVSSAEARYQECDDVRAVEYWLQNCRTEFQDYAQKEIRNKPFNDKKTIHRSLSGNLLSSTETPKTVSVILKTSSATLTGSAPSLLPAVRSETCFGKAPDNLPSIYDDLKNYNKRTKPKSRRNPSNKKIVTGNPQRNKFLRNRIKARSMEAVEEDDKERYSSHLNALLSARYNKKEFRMGDLKNNKFSYNTEKLNSEAEDCTDQKTNVNVNSESERTER